MHGQCSTTGVTRTGTPHPALLFQLPPPWGSLCNGGQRRSERFHAALLGMRRGEYERGRQAFHDNRRKVEEHNKKEREGKSQHRLELNQFADWSQEEYLATLAPTRGRPRPPEVFRPGRCHSGRSLQSISHTFGRRKDSCYIRYIRHFPSLRGALLRHAT